ncbi:MAG: hypothetical protein IVW55_08480 [Chloroflexi bacterium]|nr:hypothetical protein [Chloroflexota bacterium]
MSRAMVVVGALLVVVGIVWILQGINILPGSFMTGQLFWAGAGAICVGLGAALLFVGGRGVRQG